jgi:hypothetical protein
MLLAAACSGAPGATGHCDEAMPLPAVEPWPAAERLFRSDPDWRGGDAAYSVPLDRERTLWLFGDSFVARAAGACASRRDCAFVRNSIGLQTGADPTAARMQFAWRCGPGGPGDWLPPDGAVWMWPLHGVRLGDAVVVFCTRVTATGAPGPFGFRAVGWSAFVLRGIEAPLEQWRLEPAQLPPPAPFAVVVGTAVVADAEHVYAFALREPGDHAVLLLRWPRARAAAGDLRLPEWRDGATWRRPAELRQAPAPVLAQGAPEFTVVRQAGGGFAMVQSVGFGRSDVAVRTAALLAGPWSAPAVVFHPPQSDLDGVMTYAAKALMLADGTALATYASNAADLGRLVADETLYYPHCLRLRWPDERLRR